MSKRTRYSVLAVALVVVTLLYIMGSKFMNLPAWAFVVAVAVMIGASVAQDLALYYRSPRGR